MPIVDLCCMWRFHSSTWAVRCERHLELAFMTPAQIRSLTWNLAVFSLNKGLHVDFQWTFYCKHLTAQFHRERLWLEKLLTRSSKPVSVLYISPRGLATVQLSQSSVLNVGGVISFQDSAGRRIWYMVPKSLLPNPTSGLSHMHRQMNAQHPAYRVTVDKAWGASLFVTLKR